MAPPSPFRTSVTGRTNLIAHRGDSAHAPENTLAAFRLAEAAGVDLIELDVHLTRDDEVVVIHDETLERTTSGRGQVRERTLAEIRALSITGSDERVSTLAEVAAWARDTRLGLEVEIKQPTPALGRARYEGIAERVCAILAAHDLVGRSIVHSFDHLTVRRVRELLPGATTAVLWSSGTFIDPVAVARGADASGIHARWAAVSEDLCDAAHRAGLHIHAWGLPEPLDPALVARLLAFGVDSLSANDPVALRALLAVAARSETTTTPA